MRAGYPPRVLLPHGHYTAMRDLLERVAAGEVPGSRAWSRDLSDGGMRRLVQRPGGAWEPAWQITGAPLGTPEHTGMWAALALAVRPGGPQGSITWGGGDLGWSVRRLPPAPQEMGRTFLDLTIGARRSGQEQFLYRAAHLVRFLQLHGVVVSYARLAAHLAVGFAPDPEEPDGLCPWRRVVGEWVRSADALVPE